MITAASKDHQHSGISSQGSRGLYTQVLNSNMIQIGYTPEPAHACSELLDRVPIPVHISTLSLKWSGSRLLKFFLFERKLNSSSAPAPRGACKRDMALPLGQRSRKLKQHMISAPTLGAAGVGLGQHHEHETPPAPHCHHDLILLLLLLLLHLLALGPAVTRLLLHLHFIVTLVAHDGWRSETLGI